MDGSGKTTQIKRLIPYFRQLGFPVVNFYEPTHGSYGIELRNLFKTGHIIPIQEEIELSLKDRREDVTKNILPSLKQGKIVLLDRYYWSNVAYQGTIDPNYSMNYILDKSKEFPEPDYIFYFDISVEIAIQRISTKRKPNVYESNELLSKSKNMYESLIKDMPNSFTGNFVSISAEKNEETVFNILKDNLTQIFNKWKNKMNLEVNQSR